MKTFTFYRGADSSDAIEFEYEMTPEQYKRFVSHRRKGDSFDDCWKDPALKDICLQIWTEAEELSLAELREWTDDESEIENAHLWICLDYD